MTGVWVVDIGTYPMTREVFNTHLAATTRAAELERNNVRHVVCWFIPDVNAPWIEPLTIEEAA